MKNSEFCNLHVHSEYSSLDSLCKITGLVEKCKNEGFKYCAITDHGNINGTIRFQKTALENGIIPIIGEEFYITENIEFKDKEHRKNCHLIVLCKNEIGWKNILKMNTIAHIEGYYYKPRIDPKTLLDHSEGLIFSTACVSSFVNTDWGTKLFNSLIEKHRDDVYGEIQPHTNQLQLEMNEKILRLTKKYENLKLISTSDAHYINLEDKDTHDVLLVIQDKKVMSDPTRWQFTKGFDCYFPTADQMIMDFVKQDQLDRKTYLNAMRNTIEIAEKCKDFRIKKGEISLPNIPGLDNVNYDDYLKSLCVEGLKKKGLQKNKTYTERMKYELEVIKSKNVSLYFIILYDLFQWMHKNDILTNCRGSVGNSLVANLIEITNIDPIFYNLPFSRFLNEERNDLPDIDVDVTDDRRYEVIEYLRSRYGSKRVANISTFSFLKDKSAIRDVARVFEINNTEVNNFCKDVKTEIPGEHEFCKKHPNIIKHVNKLKGITRQTGVHAAGIVLSNVDISESGQCNLIYGKEDSLTINWDKYDAEYCGLVKFDLLGVKALTIIRETLKFIKNKHNIDVDYNKFDLNDKKVFDAMSRGETIGSFQMSGFATAEVTKEMGVEDFRHIIHAVALSRPGPRDSGMTSEYIERKHNGVWDKKHPLYEEILKETYGIIVMQDDVMNVIHKVAGLPFSTADKIRSIIGKKRDVSEFAPYRKQFIDGCLKQKTLSEEEANEIWNGFEKHALYSFNKAHSTFYAMLSYKTMWLKLNYPSEFLAASLTYGGDDHKPDLIKEARRLGIKVIPPKVGLSNTTKWTCDNNILVAPFTEIKGIGEKTLEKLAAKTEGFFSANSVPIKGKLKKILDEINAFDVNAPLPATACNYFDIDICEDWAGRYPKLIELYGNKFKDYNIDDLLSGNVNEFNFVEDVTEKPDLSDVQSCKLCELHKECDHKVLPSIGSYNIMLLAEAAFVDEHREKKVLIGKSGKTLWKELKRYDLHRDMFYITNSILCCPLKSRNPRQNHVDACKPFLMRQIEIIKPKIILCLGNWARYSLTGELFGIKKANATCEWNEQIGSYICYCMHPSSTGRSVENMILFSKGIEFFSDKLEALGDI